MFSTATPGRLLTILLFTITLLPVRPTFATSPLRVSANGHYLEQPNGKPFFFLSDTEWLLNVHTDAQVCTILDARKRQGFTVVQVFGTRRWSRTDKDGHEPFLDNSPTRFDKLYWNRWRWIADQANHRGLLLLFIYGEQGRDDSPWKVHDPNEAYAYGRLIGRTFRDLPNMIFCNGQDSDPSQGIGVDGWRAMAKGVADGVNGKDALHGPTDYSTTTMTDHGAGVSQNFHDDAWLDFYGPEVWHDNGAVYDRIHNDYTLTDPVKPTVLLEGSYEDEITDHGPSPITTRYMRTEAWRTFFSGGAGYGYGHFDNWHQTKSISYLDSLGAHQMTLLASFLTKHHWWRLVPDQEMIAQGEGSGETRVMAAHSADGDAEYVYFPDRVTVQLHLDRITQSKMARAVWFDPCTGKTQSAGTYPTSAATSFTPPDGWEDAVLVLSRIGDDS